MHWSWVRIPIVWICIILKKRFVSQELNIWGSVNSGVISIRKRVQKLLIIISQVLVFWSSIRWMLITISSYSVLWSDIWTRTDSMAFRELWSIGIWLIDLRDLSENQEWTDKMIFECMYQKVNKSQSLTGRNFGLKLWSKVDIRENAVICWEKLEESGENKVSCILSNFRLRKFF